MMTILLVLYPLTYLKMYLWNLIFINFSLDLNNKLLLLMFFVSLLFIFKNIMFFKIIYMMGSKSILYFNTLMFLFFLSMVILILSSSFFLLLLSWEGLGISSYLLVLYYMNWNSVQGSYLTMITNRYGDTFLMMFLFIYFMKNSLMLMMMMFMMSITKSAQMPFMSWLPAAMAAPTPVSALVHSSTLVTAGILLFFKFNIPIYLMMMKEYLIMFGLMTMLSGSISALVSNDVKKMVAFSTLSQLGFMLLTFYSLWVGLVMFHLLAHAFVKSLMFILTGFMILKMFSQSIFSSCFPNFKYSSISLFLMVFLIFCNTLLTMMFFSKEISNCFMSTNLLIMKIIYFMVMMITLFYMLRMYFMFNFFLSSNKIKVINKFHITKLNLNYLIILTIFSIMWFINMIKFKFNLVMWNLLMTLILLWIFLKFKYINFFIYFFLINNWLNKIMLYTQMLLKEEQLILNMKYNFYIYKTKLLNWLLMINLMMLIVIYLKLFEFLIQF